MIRIVTTRRLKTSEAQLEAARDRAHTAQEQAAAFADRAVRDLLAATRRITAAERRAEAAVHHAEVWEHTADHHRTQYRQLLAAASLALALTDHRSRAAEEVADRSRAELDRLAGAVSAVVSGPVQVFVLLRHGRLHGVHATETAAYRQAETDPAHPAAPQSWGPWSTGRGDATCVPWRVVCVPVHGLFADVHALAAGVHSTRAGVHGADERGGCDG